MLMNSRATLLVVRSQQRALISFPQMQVHPMWVPKYRTLWKPLYYDNIARRWDSKLKSKKGNYRTQDPLWFDHD